MRTCAWCGRAIGSPRLVTALPTHGICPECYATLTSELPVSLKDLLDEIPFPVMAMDGDAHVSMTNARALALLGSTESETRGQLGGEVFRCVHANEPGGCGGTIHCSGCTVRRCVMHTFRTGECQVLVPASLKRSGRDVEQEISLLITTVKRGEIVLLMVHQAG